MLLSADKTDQVSDAPWAPARDGRLAPSACGVREALRRSSFHEREETLTGQKEPLLLEIVVVCMVFPQQKYKELAELTSNSHHARDVGTPPCSKKKTEAQRSNVTYFFF